MYFIYDFYYIFDIEVINVILKITFYLIDSYGDTVDGLIKDLNFDHDKYDVDIWYEDVFYWNKDLEEEDYTKEEYNEYLDELIEELGLN